ncbi:type II toxin-antitoxin system VapC family toxin [Myxococcota bacterium]|nr:type II toxin-antitoxin system VapC family toxin [Myxococcota bacterium]
MHVYLDSSVILRAAFGEPGAFRGWPRVSYGVSSRLAALECLRTLDRRRVRTSLSDTALARVRGTVLDLLSRLALVPLSPVIVARAAEPFPTALGTLDALHLATALHWQAATGDVLTFVSHDDELSTAARACGFETVG